MKNKKHEFIPIILTLSLLFTSCVKEDKDPIDPDDEITEPSTPEKLNSPAALFSGDEALTNTSGNLNNNARSIEIDGWVYFNVPTYTRESVEIPYGGFYKMKTDGSELARINDELGQNYFAVNGLIYNFDGRLFDPKNQAISKITYASSYNSLYFQLVLDDVILALVHDGTLNRWNYVWMTLDGSKYYKMSLPRLNNYRRMDYKDGWLYYVNENGLNRIHPDDSNQTLVTRDASEDFLISGDSLYYVNLNDGKSLYKSDLNGSNLKKLVDQPVKHLNSDRNILFFVNETDGLVYRVNTDGSQLTVISSVKASVLLVSGDWLCFNGEQDNSKNYRISLKDWTQEELFLLEKPTAETSGNETHLSKGLTNISQPVITVENWIYYDLEGLGLYKEKTDGSSKTKLADFNVGSMMIIGEYLYYTNSDYMLYLFRMKKDGTQIKLISPQITWSFSAKDQWIYTKNHKIKTDGSLILDVSIKSYPRLIKDRIYYQEAIDESGYYGLISTKLDGSDIKSLLDPKLQTYAWFDQDKIYYTLYDETTEKTKLMRLDPVTKVSTPIVELSTYYWLIKEIHDGRVYWLSKDEKTSNVLSFDGTFQKALITLSMGDYYDWIEVSSDRIYVNVKHANTNATLYSFALDGSDQKEMTP